MSYCLVFTRSEIPEDDHDALGWIKSQFEAYHSDHRPAHPMFQKLHDALTSRFPCICDLEEHEQGEGAWVDGPLIKNFSHDLAIVAFHFTRIEDVMPFVVETAMKVGCAVFDLQGMVVYRPEQD